MEALSAQEGGKGEAPACRVCESRPVVLRVRLAMAKRIRVIYPSKLVIFGGYFFASFQFRAF